MKLRAFIVIVALALCTELYIVTVKPQVKEGPPEPIPPAAYTVVCGTAVVEPGGVPGMIEQFRAAGCNHSDVDYLTDGFYLVRATRIVIESP
jgi:hypothetical protein